MELDDGTGILALLGRGSIPSIEIDACLRVWGGAIPERDGLSGPSR